MNPRKAAGIGLILMGAALISGGIAIDTPENVGIEGVRFFGMFLGGALSIGGLILILGRDFPLTPWDRRSAYMLPASCYITGIGIIFGSFFPLSLAIRDPYYRVLSLVTFGGSLFIGVAFLVAGRNVGRKSGGNPPVH